MPGRLILTTPTDAVAAALGARLADGGDPPRANVAPGQPIRVMGADRRLVSMRWGLIPVGRVNARGRPVMETIINARSESVFDKSAFAGVARAVVPADGWYEWTGEKRKKTAWRIRRADGGLLFFAAITDVWTGPGGVQVEQVATVTCEPNADVKPYHHRMGVILPGDAVAAWLDADEAAAAALMQPAPEGLLVVEEATGVDWNGP